MDKRKNRHRSSQSHKRASQGERDSSDSYTGEEQYSQLRQRTPKDSYHKKDMIQEVQQNNIRLTAMRMTGNTSLVDVNHLELSDNPIHLTAMKIAGTKSLTK